MGNLPSTFLDDAIKYYPKPSDDINPYLYGRGVTDKQIESLGLREMSYPCPNLPPTPEGKRFNAWLKAVTSEGHVVAFPLTDIVGRVVGIHARNITHKVYSTFTLERCKCSAIFFGMSKARSYIWKKRRAILVEGPFDLFPVQRIAPEVLCTMGAKVSDAQIKMLGRMTSEVVVMFDGDTSGKTGAADVERRLKPYRVYSRYAPVVGAKDPGSLWETLGETEASRRIKGSLEESL